MIYPNTDLKFRVWTEYEDFDMERDEFLIRVIDRYGRCRYEIPKADCFQDEEGRWYFTMERVRSGWHWAKFAAVEPDGDYDKLSRVICDAQPLVCVGYCEKHAPRIHDCDAGHHKVHYEQVWTVELDDGVYLADRDGNLILSNEGSRIQIKKRSTI
jgi:hypothetical protein